MFLENKVKVKSVAIIGAGPSGLAAAKYLLAENAFEEIVILEQRDRVGGLWNHTVGTNDPLCQLPSNDTHGQGEQPIWPNNRRKMETVFISPMYDELEANIPHTLMQFSDQAFPEGIQLFPKHDIVLSYLEKYANSVRHLVRFSTQVLDVSLQVSQDGHEAWRVKTRQLVSQKEEVKQYDAVVVASGHSNLPYIPDIPGIAAWDAAHPGRITHSKYYRNRDEFKNKKVIVVGNFSSGLDIANQIGCVAAQPLLQSQRHAPSLPFGIGDFKREVPPIAEFLLSSSPSIRFEGTNEVATDIDTIVFATGYLYSYPFLCSLSPPLVASSGQRTHHTYAQLFYTAHPTLALLALPERTPPFPIMEAQAAVIARAWSGRIKLPSRSTMETWDRESEESEFGSECRSFHLFKYPGDFEYITALHAWANQSSTSNPEGRSQGKTHPPLSPHHHWLRRNFSLIKKAFNERGEAGREIRTVEELGFFFDEEEELKKEEDMRIATGGTAVSSVLKFHE